MSNPIYAERAAEGSCMRCGKPRDAELVKCLKYREQHRNYMVRWNDIHPEREKLAKWKRREIEEQLQWNAENIHMEAK